MYTNTFSNKLNNYGQPPVQNFNNFTSMSASTSDSSSIQENVMPDQKKYKVELCNSFMEQGYCKYGNKCKFAHGKSELNKRPTNQNYKQRNCESFHKNGFCPYGPRCTFIHEERTLSNILKPHQAKLIKTATELKKLLEQPNNLMNLTNSETSTSSRLNIFERMAPCSKMKRLYLNSNEKKTKTFEENMEHCNQFPFLTNPENLSSSIFQNSLQYV